MAVSKRTRYEVLRRDNHTCRYCGRRPPEVELTVDHVVPVSLGGSDAPSNLVAACKDCNAGKTSSSPDSQLVEQVDGDALRWARAVAVAAAGAAEDVRAAAAFRRDFEDAWRSYTYGWREHPFPLPPSWEASVDRWRQAGLTLDLLLDAVRIAMNGPAGADAKFRYLAGVINRRMESIHVHARAAVESPAQHPPTGPCGHCSVCTDPQQRDPGTVCEASPLNPDAHECEQCGQIGCLYQVGYSAGFHDGFQLGDGAGAARATKAARYWLSEPLDTLKLPAGSLPHYVAPVPWWAS